MASARCLLSFCSLLRSFSMSHCRSSTVVSISDTLVSELVTLSTNSLYCNKGKDMTTVVLSVTSIHKNNGYIHTKTFLQFSYSHTSTISDTHSHTNTQARIFTIDTNIQKQCQEYHTSMDILWCLPCRRVARSRSRMLSSSRVWLMLTMSDWLSSSHAANKDE